MAGAPAPRRKASDGDVVLGHGGCGGHTVTTLLPPKLRRCAEGLAEINGREFYVIPDIERLDPFLMSLLSDSDHWCFISSTGALTAGRRDQNNALFPYETDDRLHRAAGIAGPATVVRTGGEAGAQVWEPFGRWATAGVRRAVAKATLGDVVLFEEFNEPLGLAAQFRWATSDRFGFVRRVQLTNVGSSAQSLRIADGIVNVLPAGLVPDQYRSMSNLTNAYRRSEIVGGPTSLTLHTLEAMVSDQASPEEALRATVTWSTSPTPASAVSVEGAMLGAVRAGERREAARIVTGRPGAHLVVSDLTLAPGESCAWYIVADVGYDHLAVSSLQAYLDAAGDVEEDLENSIEAGSNSLARKLGAADGFQRTGDDRASAHHTANVLFNIARGGVFLAGYECATEDFARFLDERNRYVAEAHAGWLEALPAQISRSDLIERSTATGDPDLTRLALEYLPLTFSRRHGDPSRPWNRFSIQVRNADGTPVLHHEGNWRDIFQNWEALCLSFPDYLPGVVATFVNASTPDGFNPYRITRTGIEWEVPDPDDPWSNIGYWGDHQIVYLLRLLELTDRMLPGAVDGLLGATIFTYADVPYRLRDYDDLVQDPRSSIEYDDDAAARAMERTGEMGGDGKLLHVDGALYRVSLLEKLLVPALSKLSCFVPGGGIWMNTQRPEWNDANNALVGYGLSMVTLCYLRRYLSWLQALIVRTDHDSVEMSSEVAVWLRNVTEILATRRPAPGGERADVERAATMAELGGAFDAYRSAVYAAGFSGRSAVPSAAIAELIAVAMPHLDVTIAQNRRNDGLYHSYNLVAFGEAGARASVRRLPEMLEGQVAVLSAGVLSSAESADLLDALYASSLYRPDQESFILYPNRRPPPFLEKNRIPSHDVASNPLLAALLAAGDARVLSVDANGTHRFHPDLQNAADLAKTLDVLAAEAEWGSLVAAHRSETLAAYESVFHHHAFTGRSGTMYAYEGLGSIYWHMVAKLLVAIQECVADAHRSGAAPEVVRRLRDGYFRVRAGLGFNKTAAEYGAFPTDPYSHTPAHAGAQQPGMTGQVKEEILTRLGELGVWLDDGEFRFDPLLLRSDELVVDGAEWTFFDVDGRRRTIELEPGSFGLTVCQVPVIVTAAVSTGIAIEHADGEVSRIDRPRLGRQISREIFERSGTVRLVRVQIAHAATG